MMENWINSKGNEGDIVLNTQIQLARNLIDVPFVNKLEISKAQQNNELIYDSLKEIFSDENLVLCEMSSNDKNLYDECINKYLITSKLLNQKDKSAFIINENETFSIMLNEEEHIKINCITSGLNLENTLNDANEIDNRIEKKFEYAFNEKFGYLTASPINVGTGLTASILLHLPALTLNNEINKFTKSLECTGIKMKSKYCDESGEYGSLYEISNRGTIGVKEQETIGNLKGLILNLISEEKKAREVLLTKKKRKLLDRIYRAYALLNSAILLSEKEAIKLLSDVRFGMELSIINIEKSKLNKAMIFINNTHIKSHFAEDLSDEELDFERAEIVKQILIQ